MSPRTASRRPLPTGVSARNASAAETDTGEALYVSSTSVAPPGSVSITIRCGAWLPASRAAATSVSGTAKCSATATAARA